MSVTIQVRRDLAANWTSTNPVLNQGELGLETDTDKAKMGDGSTAWTSLDYWSPGGTSGGVSSFNTRTGAVTAQSGDYTAADVGADASGAASTAQSNAESFATSAVATETSRAETAEALLAPLASPALTGNPTAPTQSAGNDSTRLATTAYADAAVGVETSRAETAEALKLAKASNLSDVASQQTALNNLAGAVTSGDYLRGNGSNVQMSAIQAADVPQLADYAPTGLTGATAASRYAGATVSGPPVSGTFAVGDWAVDQAGSIWTAVLAGTAPMNGQFRRMGDHSWQFRPESYGAVTGLFAVHDAVMSSTGSAVLTSASGLFTSAMVGWLALVNVGAASANQAPLITTIASYQSATQVTLSADPPATAAGNPAIFAPDNTTALQAAWAAAQAYANTSQSRSAELVLADLYAMGTAPTLGSTSGPFYGYSLMPVNVPDTTGAGPKMNLSIVCERAPGDELNYWDQLTGQLAGSGIVVMLAAPSTNGTWGIPSVIGGPTVATWSGGSLTGGFANIRLHVDRLKIVVPYNPGWIGVDARYLACLSGGRYGYQAFAAGVLGGGLGPILSVPSGSVNFNGAGIRFPVKNNNDLCDFDSITCEGVADTFWFGDHVSIRKVTSISTYNGIVFDSAAGSGSGYVHGSHIGEFSCEATIGSCVLVNGTGVSHSPLVIGLLDSENSSTPNTVTDSGILFGQIQWYDITATVPKVSGSTGLKIINNRLSPGVWGSPPAVPLTTVAVAASALPWRDATVNVQPNGATITSITVGSTVLTGITSGMIPVPSGTSITLAYTGGTPTWQWVLF